MSWATTVGESVASVRLLGLVLLGVEVLRVGLI